MKRLHAIELEDQPWCPHTIRSGVTDYLGFALAKTRYYDPVAPVLAAALQKSGTHRILDLCSGGGGPWPCLQPLLRERGVPVRVCLSDKFPNFEAFQRVRQLSRGAIEYHSLPVDATRVSVESPVFRTLFTSFHHFRPGQARTLLADAVAARQGIGIFEATERKPLMLLLTLLSPVHMMAFTLFIRPFRWSRLLWTYLVPVMPLVLLFDGLVSCFRAYTVEDLRELTLDLDSDHYTWEIGRLPTRLKPIHITYLIGVPV
jgi:hypothetical protein